MYYTFAKYRLTFASVRTSILNRPGPVFRFDTILSCGLADDLNGGKSIYSNKQHQILISSKIHTWSASSWVHSKCRAQFRLAENVCSNWKDVHSIDNWIMLMYNCFGPFERIWQNQMWCTFQRPECRNIREWYDRIHRGKMLSHSELPREWNRDRFPKVCAFDEVFNIWNTVNNTTNV